MHAYLGQSPTGAGSVLARPFDAPVADASSKSMPPISLQRVADCAPVAACKSRSALGSVASRNAALAPVGSKRAAGGGAAGGAED